MVIVIDTRDQRPWDFGPGVTTVRRALPTGDYTVEGFEGRLCIERKSIGDFVNTVIHDWIRFRKELIRMSGFDVACIVVEGTADDLAAGRYESQAKPASVLGRAHAIFLDHGVPVLFWGPRGQCEPLVLQFLTLAVKKLS